MLGEVRAGKESLPWVLRDGVWWSISRPRFVDMELPTSLDRCCHASPMRSRKHLLRDYTQRLEPATPNPFAGSAESGDYRQQKHLEELPDLTFNLRYITARRHTACPQIQPGSIERRSKHNQSCNRRTSLIGAFRPVSKESSSIIQSLRMSLRTAISLAMMVVSTCGVPTPAITSTEMRS